MVYGFSPFGYDGSLVQVEVDLRRGIPAVDIVGLADGSVAGSRERVRSAILNSNLEFPQERVLIALSPADLKKEGAIFDLPVALGVLEAQYGLELNDDVLVMGELSLNGEVRGVRGVYAALQSALENGIQYAIVPESMDIDVPYGIKVKTVKNITEAYFALCDLAQNYYETFKLLQNTVNDDGIKFTDLQNDEPDIDTVKGHEGLKYAMTVAVAGRHNIMAFGSPGSGKPLVLGHMNEILPDLTKNESESVKRVYSLAGLYSKHITKRPFRMPYQTTSLEGMCGGGLNVRPGEITLAHNGVLFLDEAAEFRSSVLQMIRVPLESGYITLSRAGRSTVYPARFQLAMTTNSCPCGFYGDKDRMCLCSAHSVENYWKKFSSPLLDRIGIRYNMNNPIEAKSYTLKEMREMIKRAWERQFARHGKLNQDLTPDELVNIKFSKDAELKLNEIAERNGYSVRTLANLRKIARTIADMSEEEREEVTLEDVLTAEKLHGSTPLDVLNG